VILKKLKLITIKKTNLKEITFFFFFSLLLLKKIEPVEEYFRNSTFLVHPRHHTTKVF
jgi:hypothetical protein